MKSIVYGVLFLFLLTGCASKITLQQLKTPKLAVQNVQKLALLSFKNDSVNQMHAIQTALTNHTINNQPYFTTIVQEDLEPILEQKLLNELRQAKRDEFASLQELQEAHAILQGEVLEASLQTHRYLKPIVDKTRCIEFNSKKECVTFYKEIQRCQTNYYVVQTSVKIVEISSAKILFSNVYSKEDTISKCNATAGFFPSKTIHLHSLAQHIANNLIQDIAPYYEMYEVEVIEDSDIKLKEEALKKFEHGVDLIMKKQYQKAQNIFSALNDSLALSKSAAVLYNLALCYEAQNNPHKALTYYEQAMQTKLEPSKLFLDAVLRIKEQINHQVALEKFID
jgi:tetratricopeptide (TPR) repeat protein